MKRSLNENIRIEFREIMDQQEFQERIKNKKLDPEIINAALEKLLNGKSSSSRVDEEVEGTRGEFENYIINTLKTKQH